MRFFEKFYLNPKKFDLHKITCHLAKNVYFWVYFFANILILPSSVPVQSNLVQLELSTALILIISTPYPTHPPTPGIVVMRHF